MEKLAVDTIVHAVINGKLDISMGESTCNSLKRLVNKYTFMPEMEILAFFILR